MSRTIILGFIVEGGAFIGFDSKGTTADGVESPSRYNKLHHFPDNSRILGTLSGNVEQNERVYNMLDKKVSADTTVDIVATLADSFAREKHLGVGHLFFGFKREKAVIYRVRYTELMRKVEDYGTVGSGRHEADVVLKARYRTGMNREEGFQLAFDAMLYASLVDFHCGGWLTVLYLCPKRRDLIAETRCHSVVDLYHKRFAYQQTLLIGQTALFVLVHQSIEVGAEAMKLFFSAFGGKVCSCHCLGCPDMVGKDYHLYRVSFFGDFARSVYEKAITEWVDAKNDMVIEFEFDDQPLVYMKYSADEKPMIICEATKQNLGIILNYEMATWSVQDFSEIDEAAF